jgi:hypothetical protein
MVPTRCFSGLSTVTDTTPYERSERCDEAAK